MAIIHRKSRDFLAMPESTNPDCGESRLFDTLATSTVQNRAKTRAIGHREAVGHVIALEIRLC